MTASNLPELPGQVCLLHGESIQTVLKKRSKAKSRWLTVILSCLTLGIWCCIRSTKGESIVLTNKRVILHKFYHRGHSYKQIEDDLPPVKAPNVHLEIQESFDIGTLISGMYLYKRNSYSCVDICDCVWLLNPCLLRCTRRPLHTVELSFMAEHSVAEHSCHDRCGAVCSPSSFPIRTRTIHMDVVANSQHHVDSLHDLRAFWSAVGDSIPIPEGFVPTIQSEAFEMVQPGTKVHSFKAHESTKAHNNKRSLHSSTSFKSAHDASCHGGRQMAEVVDGDNEEDVGVMFNAVEGVDSSKVGIYSHFAALGQNEVIVDAMPLRERHITLKHILCCLTCACSLICNRLCCNPTRHMVAIRTNTRLWTVQSSAIHNHFKQLHHVLGAHYWQKSSFWVLGSSLQEAHLGWPSGHSDANIELVADPAITMPTLRLARHVSSLDANRFLNSIIDTGCNTAVLKSLPPQLHRMASSSGYMYRHPLRDDYRLLKNETMFAKYPLAVKRHPYDAPGCWCCVSCFTCCTHPRVVQGELLFTSHRMIEHYALETRCSHAHKKEYYNSYFLDQTFSAGFHLREKMCCCAGMGCCPSRLQLSVDMPNKRLLFNLDEPVRRDLVRGKKSVLNMIVGDIATKRHVKGHFGYDESEGPQSLLMTESALNSLHESQMNEETPAQKKQREKELAERGKQAEKERKAEEKRREKELREHEKEVEKERKRLLKEAEEEAERERKEAEKEAEQERREAEKEAAEEKREAEKEAEKERKEEEKERKREEKEAEKERKEEEKERKREEKEAEKERKQAEKEAERERKEAEKEAASS
jgi:hypothetical protein